MQKMHMLATCAGDAAGASSSEVSSELSSSSDEELASRAVAEPDLAAAGVAELHLAGVAGAISNSRLKQRTQIARPPFPAKESWIH